MSKEKCAPGLATVLRVLRYRDHKADIRRSVEDASEQPSQASLLPPNLWRDHIATFDNLLQLSTILDRLCQEEELEIVNNTIVVDSTTLGVGLGLIGSFRAGQVKNLHGSHVERIPRHGVLFKFHDCV